MAPSLEGMDGVEPDGQPPSWARCFHEAVCSQLVEVRTAISSDIASSKAACMAAVGDLRKEMETEIRAVRTQDGEANTLLEDSLTADHGLGVRRLVAMALCGTV